MHKKIDNDDSEKNKNQINKFTKILIFGKPIPKGGYIGYIGFIGKPLLCQTISLVKSSKEKCNRKIKRKRHQIKKKKLFNRTNKILIFGKPIPKGGYIGFIGKPKLSQK